MTTPPLQGVRPGFPAQSSILVHLEALKIRLLQLCVSEESDGFYRSNNRGTHWMRIRERRNWFRMLSLRLQRWETIGSNRCPIIASMKKSVKIRRKRNWSCVFKWEYLLNGRSHVGWLAPWSRWTFPYASCRSGRCRLLQSFDSASSSSCPYGSNILLPFHMAPAFS